MDDVKVEKDIVTFENDIVTVYEVEDEDTLVEEGHQIGRGTVFLRDTCQREDSPEKHSYNRFPSVF